MNIDRRVRVLTIVNPFIFFLVFIFLRPVLLSGQTLQPLFQVNRQTLSATDQKISPYVHGLVQEMQREQFSALKKPSPSYVLQKSTPFMQINQNAQIYLTVEYMDDHQAASSEIIRLGGIITTQTEKFKKIICWLPYTSVGELAQNTQIKNISETERGHVRSGSVNSEGDTLHYTLDVRNLIGADGSGITVGVISDGCDSIAAAQSSGDLPGSVNVIDNFPGGDEGTAMLEIVHDLAPGAGLAFSEGIENSLEFINSISDLVAAGCNIVVDDIGYFTEPWFEEGPIATAVRQAIENDGIVYASSAGNSQDEHYEGDFSGLGSRLGLNDVHDFGGGDWGQSITLNQNQTFYIFLQWNDPFGSSVNDYRIYLANSTLTSRYAIIPQQPDINDPLVYIAASGGPLTFNLIIERMAGAANRRVEIEYNFFGSATVNEHNTLPGSINGQPAVDAVIATGALRYNTPGLIEYFSSIGPSRIYSYPSYSYVDRLKPDIVAVDGNQITGAGGFGQEWPPGSGDIRFFGTSAAAPHAAAGAAVVWSAYPNLTNTEVKQRLLDSAVDLGTGGFDFTYGYGRMDVQQACDSPPFTVSGINGGSNSLISAAISPGDPDAELTGYVLTAGLTPFRSYLESIRFGLTGSADAADFNGFSLYIDRDSNRQIVPGVDSLLATTGYTNPLVFDGIGYAFDDNGHDIILTADVAADANAQHVLNIELDNNSDVLAFSGVSALPANFPFTPADISLPVQLLSFRHEIELNGVRLLWETAGELKTQFFEIERKTGESSALIGRIEAAGNNSTVQNYSYFDPITAYKTEIHYSLFVTETDGHREKLAEATLRMNPPSQIVLLQNYPNPFNPHTWINFSLPEAGKVVIKIFNITGQQIATLLDRLLPEGNHQILFDGTLLPSGIYFLRLAAESGTEGEVILSQRLLLLK